MSNEIPPLCTSCDNVMELLVAKNGDNAGG